MGLELVEEAEGGPVGRERDLRGTVTGSNSVLKQLSDCSNGISSVASKRQWEDGELYWDCRSCIDEHVYLLLPKAARKYNFISIGSYNCTYTFL